jgi:hypothetical protein
VSILSAFVVTCVVFVVVDSHYSPCISFFNYFFYLILCVVYFHSIFLFIFCSLIQGFKILQLLSIVMLCLYILLLFSIVSVHLLAIYFLLYFFLVVCFMCVQLLTGPNLCIAIGAQFRCTKYCTPYLGGSFDNQMKQMTHASMAAFTHFSTYRLEVSANVRQSFSNRKSN